MRIGIFLALAALLLCAPATAAAAPAPAPSSDNAYWLVGAWLCQSRANSSATNTFTRNGDGSIALKTRYVAVAGRTGGFDDAFRFDAAKNRWLWRSTELGVPGFLEEATAGPWMSGAWEFQGDLFALETKSGRDAKPYHIHRSLRMLFIRLNDTSYERDFEEYINGIWATFSSSNCART